MIIFALLRFRSCSGLLLAPFFSDEEEEANASCDIGGADELPISHIYDPPSLTQTLRDDISAGCRRSPSERPKGSGYPLSRGGYGERKYCHHWQLCFDCK